MPDEEVTKPDTTNYFVVGVQGDRIVALVLARAFTRSEAMNLAAWLVTTCELLPREGKRLDPMAELAELVAAVQST